jgi:hypothetical protein
MALRILTAWTYNKSGKSLLAAILLHTMDNRGYPYDWGSPGGALK